MQRLRNTLLLLVGMLLAGICYADITPTFTNPPISEVAKQTTEQPQNVVQSDAFIQQIADLTEENGVRNTSFVVLVLLLFSTITWILKTFPKQLESERIMFVSIMKEQTTLDIEERRKDREVFRESISKLEKLINNS